MSNKDKPKFIKEMVFHVEHPGEIAAGIRPWTNTFTIQCEYEISAEYIEEFRESLRSICDGASLVLTGEEYAAMVKQQSEVVDESEIEGLDNNVGPPTNAKDGL